MANRAPIPPPRTQGNSEYKCGAGLRGENSANLDRNISEANGEFETNEYRKVTGVIDIREEEILIAGKELLIEYINQRIIEEELEADSYADKGAICTEAVIAK